MGFCKGEKVKFTLEQTMKAKRVEEKYSATVSVASALDGVGGQRHTPSAFHAGKKHGTILQEAVRAPRAGLDGCGRFRFP